jgi:predicted AlkP superfamily pyrophosphatase or phosphodiesterase
MKQSGVRLTAKHWGMMAWAILAAAAMVVMAARPVGAATAAASAEPDRIVVMISLDGLAGYYLDDPKAEMPTLRELAREGARASSMHASTPTVTWPNHTTLVTGDEPARHGVVGNNYYDRATGKRVTLIRDPVFDKDQIVKVPTIYDVAKTAGMRTAAIRWPASRNAKTLDWTIPTVATADLMVKYTTPSLRAEAEAAGVWSANASEEGDGKGHGGDPGWTKIFNLVLHKHRPQLALLHLANIDHQEHLHGPKSPEAYEAIKQADGQVREVWEELKRDYGDNATLVVVSDHGFSPIERMVLPNVILRDAGLVQVKGMRIVSGQVAVVAQAGAAMVYVTDDAHRAEIVERVRKAFAGVKGVEKVVTSDGFAKLGVADPKVDPHAPDLMLFADEGYAFGDTAAGAMSFQEKPERSGTHGHDADLPDLHATFIAWGKGIKPGARLGEVRNTDVAPTLAKLLHVELPNTDGKPLDAALSE